MQLREDEIVLRNIRRHKTPYFFQVFKIAFIAAPLYALIYFIDRIVAGEVGLILFAVLSFFVGVIIALVSLDYLLDKLTITNKRVVWSNWKSLIKREEHEAELLDIQDIEIRESGILSKIRFLNYGFLEIETAGSKVCIVYDDCPDPAAIKHFILEQTEKQRGGIHEKREPPLPNEEWSVN